MPIPESCIPPAANASLAEYLVIPDGHFWRLSTSRSIGFSALGPIPWIALDQYAVRYGFAEDEVLYEDFMFIMQRLDEAFLEHERKQQPKSKSGGG